MDRRRHLILVGLTTLALARAAGAAPAIALIGAEHGCPTRSEVALVLRTITAGGVVEGPAPGGYTVELFDEGAALRVVAPGGERIFVEPRCDERARAAAVFVALTLARLDAASPPVAIVRATPPPPPPGSRLRAAIELLARVDGAPDGLFASGAALRVEVGALLRRALIGGIVGGGGFAPVALRVGDGYARITRAPFDIGVRAGFRGDHVEIAGDAGLALGVLAVAGEGFDTDHQTTRLDVGLRLGALFRYWVNQRIAPTFDVEAVIVPAPYALTVAPAGMASPLPRVWIGVGLGLALRLH